MNDAEQLARMQEWLDTHQSYRLPVDLATYEDEDALIRSRHGLSRHARRLSRRPWVPRVWEPWADETARALGDYREEAS